MTSHTTAPPRRVAVRWVFLAVVLLLPVELLVARFLGEPYPALFQPAFSGSPQRENAAIVPYPEVTVMFADGSSEAVDYPMILPTSESLGPSLVESGYGTQARANSAENVAFLRERLASDFPDRVASSVLIRWVEIEYDIGTGDPGRVTVVKTVTIEVRS